MITDVTHHTIHREPERCVNQVATRVLASGELVAVFNEERFPIHHDSGRTILKRSKDGGITWTPEPPTIVLDWTETIGNWDCGICELADGTLLVNFTITGFFKRGVKPEQPSWSLAPEDRAMGRLDLGLQDAGLAWNLRGQVERSAARPGASRSPSTSVRSSTAAAGWAAGSCRRARS